MMSVLASLVAFFGNGLAQGSSSGCAALFFDEPTCPKSLLK